MDPVTVFLAVLIAALLLGHVLLSFISPGNGSAASVAASVKANNNIYPPLSAAMEPQTADVRSKNLVLERKLELAHMRLQRMEKELRAMQAAKSEDGELIDLRPESEKRAVKKKKN